MASQYLFFLDGIQVSEPIGWNESKRKLKRSEKYKAIFIEYINDITFHSDGYTYLAGILDSDASYYYGFCTDVVIEIKYRCSEFANFESYFDGIIKLEDAEIDIDKCQIKVNLEDNSLSSVIENKGDIAVSFDSTETIDGETLTPVNFSATVVNSSGAGASRIGYNVADSFEYIINYISNNQIIFQSSLLTDHLTSNFGFSSNIVFTNPGVDLIGAGNIVITYRNGFGQTITATAVKQGTVAATLNYIVSQLNFNNTGTTEQKYYVQDYRYISRASHNSTSTVTMFVELPGYSIISVTGASASFSSTFLVQATSNTDNSSRGLGGLTLFGGNQLRNDNTIVPLLSFNDIFEEINKLANIGMSLTTVYGVTTLRIEHISYFFDETNYVLTLGNVPGIKITKAKSYTADNITVGDGNDNRGVVGKQTQKGTWLSEWYCSSEKIDLLGQWIVDNSEINEQLTSVDDLKDEEIFLVQLFSSGQSINTENWIYSSTSGTFSNYFALNGFLTNYWRLIRSFFQIKGNPKLSDKYMTNDIDNPIKELAEFNYPLSGSDVDLLFLNREGIIKFNPGTNTATERVGFIKEIDFNNTTGECTFKLLCP